MRISAKRTKRTKRTKRAKRVNLGKIMISRKKPISRVKKIIKKKRKIIKNKTNKRKTKKMKKKHKKVKHKTTRKIRLMSRIGRRRTYHGGERVKIPKPTDANTIGEGSYGKVYIPNLSNPVWVNKIHETKKEEDCELLNKEFQNHTLALELLKECKTVFKKIKNILEIPELQKFHYLTRSEIGGDERSERDDEYETREEQQGNIVGCVYTMKRIWSANKTRIEKLIKDIEFNNQKTPTFLHLSTYRTENNMPRSFAKKLEISFFKNRFFDRPSGTSPIIKEIGFIDLRNDQEDDNKDVYNTVFNWGYSMMLFYFYCAYKNLILRDSEFALGRKAPTGAQLNYLFCYDFNQCREPRKDVPIEDAAKQYLHLSGIQIGNSDYNGVKEEQNDVWKFMPIPTTSPKFFVNLVNTIFQDAKQAEEAKQAEQAEQAKQAEEAEQAEEADKPFHIYIKNVVDQILLWLMQPVNRIQWNWSISQHSEEGTVNNIISELFKKHNIQKHYYYSIQEDEYEELDKEHELKKAEMWTKDFDNQEGMFQITKDNMIDYIDARREKCQFGLDELETNSIELELESGKKYFCNIYSGKFTQDIDQWLITHESTFLVNINLDIEMQKKIIKKMLINGFIKNLSFPVDKIRSLFSDLGLLNGGGIVFSYFAGADEEEIFYKIIKLLDEKYITLMKEAEDEAAIEAEKESPINLKALGDEWNDY